MAELLRGDRASRQRLGKLMQQAQALMELELQRQLQEILTNLDISNTQVGMPDWDELFNNFNDLFKGAAGGNGGTYDPRDEDWWRDLFKDFNPSGYGYQSDY